MNVYFKNSNGKEILIGHAEDDNEAMKVIKKFCDERSFNIHYTRWWNRDGRKIVDVGSWSENFIIE